MAHCPLCGSVVQTDALKVDAVSGWVVARGLSARVQPREAELLQILAKEFPHPVARSALVKGLWGNAVPATAAQTISVYVCRLRKALHGLGYDAPSVYNFGYVLKATPGALSAC